MLARSSRSAAWRFASTGSLATLALLITLPGCGSEDAPGTGDAGSGAQFPNAGSAGAAGSPASGGGTGGTAGTSSASGTVGGAGRGGSSGDGGTATNGGVPNAGSANATNDGIP